MIILDNQQVTNKIRRIAYQIAEVYMDHDAIVLAGIMDGGHSFARLLKAELDRINMFETLLCEVHVDKKNPRAAISTSITAAQYENKGVVLCDDVLNSGTTLVYAVRHFLDVPLTKFKTAVLVNRNHKKYPVKADFKGISLSTTLQEHVQVDLKKDNYSVSLQ
ncbi:phosphoribosyltransferase family protein [Nonlabens ponticola]|uniref:Phosphoribosyltransferase n=1 Tax=Nonlabens ponticola TaxID=2496866 RepID=A0A3S9N0H0_9FLAO|nr:phosphoribosyltransferase family protein [Nonlabens ponticola]AZQ44888.1 phosphoribosyltransferase [Nonlabens ponticola]